MFVIISSLDAWHGPNHALEFADFIRMQMYYAKTRVAKSRALSKTTQSSTTTTPSSSKSAATTTTQPEIPSVKAIEKDSLETWRKILESRRPKVRKTTVLGTN